jgi:hypothetical protein
MLLVSLLVLIALVLFLTCYCRPVDKPALLTPPTALQWRISDGLPHHQSGDESEDTSVNQ